MKKLIVLFSVFYLATFSVFGQDNVLRFEVQQAKNANIYFDSAVISQASVDTGILKHFIDTNEVFFLGNISLDVKNNNVKAINLTLPMNNKNMILELIEVPNSFYNYMVMTSDGETFPANRNIKHYRGVIKDEANSIVAITFYEDGIIGLIGTNEGNFNIVKDNQSGKQLFNTWNGESDAHQRSEIMYSNNIAPYWTGTKYRFYDTGTDFTGGAAYDLTVSNLQSQLNNGNYHFFHMATHGNVDRWQMEDTNNSFTSPNALLLQNVNANIILTTACLTNAFDLAEPCLSEAFIRSPLGSCVAYWGSSRVGWDYDDTTNALGPSFMYNARFYNRLFNNKLPLSDSYRFAALTSTTKQSYAPGSTVDGAMRWLQFTLNAIGEPEMPIYTENPISFNPSISINGTNLTVNTGGVSGCKIAVVSNDNGVSYFEVADNVSSHTFNNISTSHNYVTITKHNYIPYSTLHICTTTKFTNQTVILNKTITDCNIYVKDVTVSKGKINTKLTLDADNETVIDGDFEVQLGAELEVK